MCFLPSQQVVSLQAADYKMGNEAMDATVVDVDAPPVSLPVILQVFCGTRQEQK